MLGLLLSSLFCESPLLPEALRWSVPWRLWVLGAHDVWESRACSQNGSSRRQLWQLKATPSEWFAIRRDAIFITANQTRSMLRGTRREPAEVRNRKSEFESCKNAHQNCSERAAREDYLQSGRAECGARASRTFYYFIS